MMVSDFSEISLQTLCIDVIVKNFDQYVLDFKKTKNAADKRKFEFLLRVYSYKITCQLYERDQLQKYNLEFLINKYIKVLDMRWFYGLSCSSLFEKFKEVGPTLQEVHFWRYFGLSAHLPWMEILPFLSNVEKLNFSSDCTNEILECVGKYCHNVVDIKINWSRKVNDQGMINLCISKNGEIPCPKLKRIAIYDTAVQDRGVAHLLQNVPSLEDIGYRRLPQVLYKMHKNDLSSPDKIEPYNITSLDLSHLKYSWIYSNCLKVCLAVCPHLKSLTCRILNTTDLELISSLSELEELDIDCDSNKMMSMDGVLKLVGNKLSCFTAIECTLSVSNLAEHCPNLIYFRLIRVNFLYDQDGSIPMFPCLEKCVFEYMKDDAQTSKAITSVLNSSPVLEYVAFRHCVLYSPEFRLKILKCCMEKPLKEIYFTGSSVPISFVKDILLNCHSLSSVGVEDCFIESEAEYELKELSELLPNKPRVTSDVIDFEIDRFSYSYSDLDSNSDSD